MKKIDDKKSGSKKLRKLEPNDMTNINSYNQRCNCLKCNASNIWQGYESISD